ncbi:MAG: response regulator transcription factor [Anaerolineaceae bacterium]|nr:response regulator transcription factor [Anaerolineaceae bacterium]
MAARVLIAANDETLSRFLSNTLLREAWSLSSVTTGEGAAHLLEREQYDLLLLEMTIPVESGFDLIRTVEELYPDTRVILLSKQRSFEAVLKGLRHHVTDFLIYPMTASKLVRSVSKALENVQEGLATQGGPTYGKQVVNRLDGITINFARRTITWAGHLVVLTPSEGRLLGILVGHPGQVVSPVDIVQEVQGYTIEPTEAALVLRPLISRLRRKLARVPGGSRWIINVRGSGYLYERRNP